jgi:hypothetical protein
MIAGSCQLDAGEEFDGTIRCIGFVSRHDPSSRAELNLHLAERWVLQILGIGFLDSVFDSRDVLRRGLVFIGIGRRAQDSDKCHYSVSFD